MGHEKFFGVPLDSMIQIRKTIGKDELILNIGFKEKYVPSDMWHEYQVVTGDLTTIVSELC